ncbi:helix-turn-helix domain-containing protein [Arthrobacter koreensis]|jgi:transcriptional regulator with XRE-family HTH domain|uniref:Helix-turn-helix domain-containing protein n=1 Tax=Arthrobacter koreensis TaxID=199136 RepID=A0ABY6FU63_9MICC|nr:helix-turn-helix domain-containing protein [Arthrobacter koreensis]MDF2498021.1 family transcriptional regulator [Arthrobacter koreensis]MEB7448925.1 helix-turn-helix domain-containing protein [Arthrobacter koreensis]UYB36688.1 helix-turn-helix domain-containing protein [Arthrobacter koreensis]
MKALSVEPSNAPIAIGSRIRAARQARHLTIEQVADSTGLTKGFLSRVERDLTSPSVASLVTLCQVLSISIGDLFLPPQTTLVRWPEAPGINLGGNGINERLVTPRTERRVQVIRSEIVPGGTGEADLYSVDCDVEVLHVAEGRLELIFTAETMSLTAGDTVTFPGKEPHSWRNPDPDASAVVIWTLVSPGSA